jgi:hypothetical protein
MAFWRTDWYGIGRRVNWWWKRLGRVHLAWFWDWQVAISSAQAVKIIADVDLIARNDP